MFYLQVLLVCNHVMLLLLENRLPGIHVGNRWFLSNSPQQPIGAYQPAGVYWRCNRLPRSNHDPVILAAHVTASVYVGRSMCECVLLLLVLSQPQIYSHSCRPRHWSVQVHMSAQHDAILCISVLQHHYIVCCNTIKKLIQYCNPVFISILQMFYVVGAILTYYSIASQYLRCYISCCWGHSNQSDAPF